MSKSIRWLLAVLVSLGLYSGGAAAMLVVATVHDGGDYFSPGAIKKADAVIKEIHDKYNRDVLIETFKTVPADRADELKKIEGDGKAREEFFNKWATEQAEAREVNGVYILACRQPPHIEIKVKHSVEKELPSDDYKKLRSILIDNFKKGKDSKDEAEQHKLYDAGLIGAVEFIRDTFKTTIGNKSELAPAGREPYRAETRHPERSTGSLLGGGLAGLLCLLLFGGLVIWLIIGVIRALTGAGRGGYGPGAGAPGYGPGAGYGGYGGGGGGGFMSGLMGGLFGAAAGSWMYDRFFRGDSGGGFGGGNWSSSNTGGGAANDTGGGSDPGGYGGGGGDYGSSDSGDSGGGGGDYGGGGGDYGGGGGDYGGGGGDYGGGGGDYGGGGDSGGGGGGDY